MFIEVLFNATEQILDYVIFILETLPFCIRQFSRLWIEMARWPVRDTLAYPFLW
jgi:hypothetical protein